MKNITQYFYNVSFAIIVISLISIDIVKAEMTPLQISTMQTREYDITRRLAFDSTMGMFQDMGYIIGNADWDTGLIVASHRGETKSLLFKTSEQHQASIFIRSMGEKKTRIRISIRRQAQGGGTMAGSAASMGLGMVVPFGGLIGSVAQGAASEAAQDDSTILDPNVYQTIFNKLENSLFVTE